MLCSRCSSSPPRPTVAIPRLRAAGTSGDWTRLSRLICENCGGVLPALRPTSDRTVKEWKLTRLGLRTDGHTLLEP
jgi:hypothetical protein